VPYRLDGRSFWTIGRICEPAAEGFVAVAVLAVFLLETKEDLLT